MSRQRLYHESIFEHEGLTFQVEFTYDYDCEPPWERSEGHGVVSDWTRRDKRPGEIVLSSDRNLKRFYDVQETTAIAKRDGWGLSDENKAALIQRVARKTIKRVAKSEYHVLENGLRQDKLTWETVEIPGRDPNKPLTKGEIRAESVRRNFEFLRSWCNDQWQYVGVIVTLMVEDEDGELVKSDDPEHSDSLWGVETYEDHHMEQAWENAGNVAHQYRKQQEAAAREAIERGYWAERDVETV